MENGKNQFNVPEKNSKTFWKGFGVAVLSVVLAALTIVAVSL